MFSSAKSFNQTLADWKVDKVTDMHEMFYNALVFDQNLGWCVDSGVDVTDMFAGSTGSPPCGPTCGVTFNCP